LANYAVWSAINSTLNYKQIINQNDSVYALVGDSIMQYNNSSHQFNVAYYKPNQSIKKIKEGTSELVFLSTNLSGDSSAARLLSNQNKINNTIYINQKSNQTTDILQDINDKSVWVGDRYFGLFHFKNNQVEDLTPNSIHYNTSQAFAEKNNTMWVAGGLFVEPYHYSYCSNGFYKYEKGEWTNLNKYNLPALDTVFDLVSVAVASNESKVYFASFGWGLVEYNLEENKIVVYKKNNSTLSNVDGDPTSIRVSDLAFDSNNNLWMTNYGASNGIAVKKADGTWKSFRAQANTSNFGRLIVDKNNNLWTTTHEVGGTTGGGGLVVFNYGNDIENTNDDKYRQLVKGGGYGNLPSNNVYAIAEDKDGQIWIGTDAGVAVFSNTSDITTTGDAQQIIVSNPTDSIAAYLFSSEIINDIKVDGANRKWVATTHGVWLMSADGITEIYHFNQDNSPLLSDRVSAIGINNTNGEVFFTTENGLCSFKSDATKGGEKNEKVLVYPNPVPHNFAGTIAIRGLVDNAFVKITDINGQLIYSTKALGGQAIWDGKNLKGEKTSTGVYLVFCTNDLGTETTVAKILYEK
jgi:ligand-binding sensor domain-containing protein